MHFPTLSTLLLLALLGAPGALASFLPPPTPLTPTRVRRTPASSGARNLLINPPSAPLRALALTSPEPISARGLTNAQRLARGLPPRSPAFNRNRPLRARQSAAPCALSQPTGTLRVVRVDTGAMLGVVSRRPNAFGEYGIAQGIQGEPLEVVLRRCADDGKPFDVETLNGIAGFPFFGGIVGFASTDDNLTKGSPNYVYLGGTPSVPAGPAQAFDNSYTASTGMPRDVESALWTLAADGTGTLSATWVNIDGAPAQETRLVYVPDADALVLTGDLGKFEEWFGEVPEVRFVFVPNPSSPGF